LVVEFVSAASDRFGMKAGDFRDPLEAAVPQPRGFACGGPATLLFVQPAEQKIELPMIITFLMMPSLAIWATAFVDRSFRRRHCRTPSLECPTTYTER
jgi:hypothetical protein